MKRILIHSLALLFLSFSIFAQETRNFNGIEYKLVFADEFEGGEGYNWSDTWNLSAGTGVASSKDRTELFARKLTDLKNWKKAYFVQPEYGKNFYLKDGVAHVVQTREFDGSNWTICEPCVYTKKKFGRNVVFEYKFKIPKEGKGESLSYKLHVDTGNTKPNDYGFLYKELWLSELLTAEKNTLYYNPSTFGYRYENGVSESYQDACEHSQRSDGIVNVQDSEWFDQWHIAHGIYDDEGWHVYFDNQLIWERFWDEIDGTPEASVHCAFETGLGGEWAYDWTNLKNDGNLKELVKRLGKFNPKKNTYDFMFDYVKIFQRADKSWYSDSEKKGNFTLYEGKLAKDLDSDCWPVDLISYKYNESTEKAPITISKMDGNNQVFSYRIMFNELIDLGKLNDQGYVLEFDVKTTEKNLKFRTCFYDSLEKTSLEWTKAMDITNHHVPADGKWHKVRIPLKSMWDTGVWDDVNQKLIPQKPSDFNWQAVYKFEISSCGIPFTKDVQIDNIRLSK